MRGTRYQGAFIPPQPADASQYHQPQQVATAQQEQPVAQTVGAEQQQVQQHTPQQAASQQSFGPALDTGQAEAGDLRQKSSWHAAQPQVRDQEESGAKAGGISLNPPVPGQNTQQPRRRSPSLFERITGQCRGRGEEPLADEMPAQESGVQQQEAPQQPAQGRLNIESPGDSVQSGEDDLDIPAFLRRQAN